MDREFTNVLECQSTYMYLMDREFTRVLERQSTYIYHCDQKALGSFFPFLETIP